MHLYGSAAELCSSVKIYYNFDLQFLCMHPFLGSGGTCSTLGSIRWTYQKLSNCKDLYNGCSFYSTL